MVPPFLLVCSVGELLLLVQGDALRCPFGGSLNILLSGFLGFGFGLTFLATDLGSNKSLLFLSLDLRL